MIQVIVSDAHKLGMVVDRFEPFVATIRPLSLLKYVPDALRGYAISLEQLSVEKPELCATTRSNVRMLEMFYLIELPALNLPARLHNFLAVPVS